MTTPTAAQQFQRAVRGLPFTLSYAFGLDDDALPDAAPTVTVTNAEGTVVASGAATWASPTATFALPGADLPLRDLLTVTWAYTVSAVPVETTSQVDVCDNRLFPLSDYSNYPELATLNKTAAQLEEARRDAEDRLEQECGCAFTGRYGTEEFLFGEPPSFLYGAWEGSASTSQRTGIHRLALKQPFVQVIRALQQTTVQEGTSPTAPVDSATVTQLDLSCVQLDSYGSTLHYRDPRGVGLFGGIVVSYEHGQPVADARRICAMLARHRLLNGPLDSRATQMTGEGGGTINLATPGMFGSVFGVPEIDVFVQRHNHRVTGFLSTGV